jgi:hypothetical protein
MGKRPAPKTEPGSPIKRTKTESATPNPEIVPEYPVLGTKFTVSYDTAANRQGLRREELLKSANKQDKVVNPYPELPTDQQLLGDYAVAPANIWSSMTVYSNCISKLQLACWIWDMLTMTIVTNITYRKNEYVYIRTPDTQDGAQDMKQYWVGRILQIRAKDPQNVFALVCLLCLYVWERY